MYVSTFESTDGQTCTWHGSGLFEGRLAAVRDAEEHHGLARAYVGPVHYVVPLPLQLQDVPLLQQAHVGVTLRRRLPPLQQEFGQTELVLVLRVAELLTTAFLSCSSMVVARQERKVISLLRSLLHHRLEASGYAQLAWCVRA